VGGLKSIGGKRHKGFCLSHPTRGGWIEINFCRGTAIPCCPTPRGVGGLKYSFTHSSMPWANSSHPTRGGWIEISTVTPPPRIYQCPTPRGVGGLKFC